MTPAERFLVAPPPGPQAFKAYDGKASFDGRSEVAFRWSSTGASSEKWKAGDQFFQVRDLCGVEWRSPDVLGGHLRLVPRGGEPRASQPDRDPASVLFGLGYGPVHLSSPSPRRSSRPSGRRRTASPPAWPPPEPMPERLPEPLPKGFGTWVNCTRPAW